RVVTITGPALAIVNVLGLPAPGHPLPILGIDLVCVGDAPVVAVADLSPTVARTNSAGGWAAAALEACRRTHGALPPGGMLPTRCARWFSPLHLYTRVAPTA